MEEIGNFDLFDENELVGDIFEVDSIVLDHNYASISDTNKEKITEESSVHFESANEVEIVPEMKKVQTFQDIKTKKKTISINWLLLTHCRKQK